MTVVAGRLNRSFVNQGIDWLSNLLPPGILGTYILLNGLIGLAMLAYAVGYAPVHLLDTLIALFIMGFCTEWAPVKLTWTPLQGSNLSMSAGMAFAALLIMGPAGAILVNSGSALAYCLKEKRPFYKRLLTTSVLATSSGGAGIAYILAGGRVPMAIEETSLIAAGLAAGVFFLLNSTLISGAVSLASNRPFRSVLSNWQWLFLQMLTSLAVGMVMALAYSSGLGSPGFAVIALLLLLPWYSTYVYVQKSREVAQQNELLKQANTELGQANQALDLRFRSLRALHDIGISLNSAQSLQAIHQQILSAVVSLIGADASAVFLDHNENGNRLSITGHVGLSDQYVNASEMALNGAAIRAMREKQPLIMDKSNFQSAMLSKSAAREGIQAAASFPLSVEGLVVGGLDVYFKSEHAFTEDELNLLNPLAEEAAVAINNAQLTEQIHEGYLSTISALAATVEAKDQYTRGHSESVRHLAIDTGRQMGLSDLEIETLSLSALFHDIGKIGISDVLLRKCGRLNDEEWKIMKEHPIIGEQILRKIPALACISRITRHHHERFDGRGYPDGISTREDILAAVIAVCDAYQAMTSDRPYRKAYTHAYALEEIRNCSGTQFMPQVVDAFISVLEYQKVKLPKVYQFKPELLLQKKYAVAQTPEELKNETLDF